MIGAASQALVEADCAEERSPIKSRKDRADERAPLCLRQALRTLASAAASAISTIMVEREDLPLSKPPA